MPEIPAIFGPDRRLFGIVSRPAHGADASRPPAIIFVSAGLLHDVGPHRLYVELARRYVQQGFTSLRFDLSGIGNSAAPRDDRSAIDSALYDIRAAMDFLAENTGQDRFILCGLCSGAETAHRAALLDNRVRGLILLEGYIFPTPAYYLWHYLPRLFSLHKWLDVIASRYQRWTNSMTGAQAESGMAAALWQGGHASRKQVARELQSLCDRGVQQLAIFAGGTGDCSYAGQFRRVFRDVNFQDCIDVRFFPDADHMYILRQDRRCLLKALDEWLEARFLSDQARLSPSKPIDALLTGKSAPVPRGEEWKRPAY